MEGTILILLILGTSLLLFGPLIFLFIMAWYATWQKGNQLLSQLAAQQDQERRRQKRLEKEWAGVPDRGLSRYRPEEKEKETTYADS